MVGLHNGEGDVFGRETSVIIYVFMLQRAEKRTGAVDGTAGIGLLFFWVQWVYLEMKLNTPYFRLEDVLLGLHVQCGCGSACLASQKGESAQWSHCPTIVTSPLADMNFLLVIWDCRQMCVGSLESFRQQLSENYLYIRIITGLTYSVSWLCYEFRRQQKTFILSKTQPFSQWIPVFFVEGKGDAAWSWSSASV